MIPQPPFQPEPGDLGETLFHSLVATTVSKYLKQRSPMDESCLTLNADFCLPMNRWKLLITIP